jgi:Zn-dependent protease
MNPAIPNGNNAAGSAAGNAAGEDAAPKFCGNCGAALGQGALICGGCQGFVYAELLETLAARAKATDAAGNQAGAREAWARALTLLPPESSQHKAISDHLASAQGEQLPRPQPPIDETASHPGATGWRKLTGSVGVLGALLWKFKFALFYAFTKFKFLIFGLSKISMLLSMFASFGVYWTIYGWKFAAGFVISIYIHEMGHIAQLRAYGIKASAPLFIPLFGAVIFLKEQLKTAAQDARVGLAGPIWGVGAALFCYAMGALTQERIWIALAQAGASINLFNLIPVWQLDGGRGFHALTKMQRIRLTLLAAALWFALGVPMFFLILLGCGYRLLFTKDAAPEADTTVEIEYAGLMMVLGLLSGLPVVRA